MHVSLVLSLAVATLAGLPMWPVVSVVGILAVLFILLLFSGQRRMSETPILSSEVNLPSSTVRGYILALVDAERFADALPIARAHLHTSPGDDRVRALYAVLCASQGQLHEADEEFSRAIATISHEVSATPASSQFLAYVRAAYADTLEALRRIEDARSQRQQAATLDPSLALAQPGNASVDLLIDLTRGEELERRVFESLLDWESGRARATAFGMPDALEAARFYSAAVRAHPANARLRGDFAQALHASGDHRSAESEFREALRLNPGDPWPHVLRGQMLWRLDQMADCEQSLAEAVRLSPQTAAIRAIHGMFHFQQGHYREGEQSFLAALQVRPDVWVLSQAYGSAALRFGYIEAAARAFATAEQHGANDLRFRLAFAEVKERHGDLLGADAQHHLALQLDASQGLARAQFGGFLLRQGRLREAEKELRASLLVSESAAAHEHMARLMLIERRLDEVTQHLRLALQIDPQATGPQACQAEWLLLEGRAEDAESLASQVISIEPTAAMAHLARGGALLMLHRQLEAESALRQAVQAQPDLPDQLLAWARGTHAMGRINAALDLVGQALALRPDWPDALTERDLLVQAQQASPVRRRRLSFGPQSL